jgi:hypothetical protein
MDEEYRVEALKSEEEFGRKSGKTKKETTTLNLEQKRNQSRETRRTRKSYCKTGEKGHISKSSRQKI